MARTNDSLDESPDFRVVIVDGQGKYLAEDDGGLFFSEHRSQALVLRYRADHVETQLATLRESSGITLKPDPLLPEEVYETCDRCKDLFLPHMTFFDGKLFLCDECREAVRSLKKRKREDPRARPSALNA